MKSELQLLIEAYQKEHDYLENEMNTCTKDWDFEGAEAFRKSLVHTKRRLRVLKNLDNPHFDEINYLKWRISYISQLEVEEKRSRFSVERMKAEIPDLERAIMEMEATKPGPKIDSDEIILSFEKMLSGEISSFEVEINKLELSIIISKVEETLKINIESQKGKAIYQNTIIFGRHDLKRIGFQFDESSGLLEIENFDSSKILNTLETLSQIFFDVFGLYGVIGAKIKY